MPFVFNLQIAFLSTSIPGPFALGAASRSSAAAITVVASSLSFGLLAPLTTAGFLTLTLRMIKLAIDVSPHETQPSGAMHHCSALT